MCIYNIFFELILLIKFLCIFMVVNVILLTHHSVFACALYFCQVCLYLSNHPCIKQILILQVYPRHKCIWLTENLQCRLPVLFILQFFLKFHDPNSFIMQALTCNVNRGRDMLWVTSAFTISCQLISTNCHNRQIIHTIYDMKLLLNCTVFMIIALY